MINGFIHSFIHSFNAVGFPSPHIVSILQKEVARLEDAHERTVRCVSWHPQGHLLACASFDGTASVWMREGNRYNHVATLEGHEHETKAVAWSESGAYLATCSRDKTVWIWDATAAASSGEVECAAVLQGHTQDVKSVQWLAGNRLVSCSYDDSIRVWAPEDSTMMDGGNGDGGGMVEEWLPAATLLGHRGIVWGVASHSSSSLLCSCSSDCSLRLWELDPTGRGSPEIRWRSLYILENAHSRPIYSIDWSRPESGFGQIATGGGDDAIRIFAVENGNCLVLKHEQVRLLLSIACGMALLLILLFILSSARCPFSRCELCQMESS